MKLAQYKDFKVIGEWIKSITNHLYWCVASSPEGDGDEMVVRWKSLMEHICDRHDECYHLPLERRDRHKKWLVSGTYSITIIQCIRSSVIYAFFIRHKSMQKLYDIICNARLLTDIKKFSPKKQTSSLESYHSVVNHFMPKLLGFFHVRMHCR